MASQMDQSGKDDLKTQFATREGTYRLMTLSEYSRPNRVGYQTNQSNPQVRVSLVSLPAPGTTPNPFALPRNSSTTSSNASSMSTFTTGPGRGMSGVAGGEAMVMSPSLINSMTNGGVGLDHQPQPLSILASPTAANHSAVGNAFPAAGGIDRICFNFGKELYVYAYRGCKKLSPELSKPIDKKLYKGTNPSCHDFNETTAMADGAPLLVGFTTGQIQLVQPGKREPGRLFNEERLIDKTKVTCLKWLPQSPNLFLVSHASGHLYLYNEELPCTPSAPNYHTQKMGDGYSIQTCKSKQPRNPIFRWTFGPLTTSSANGNGCINELAFSPCGLMLAIVSQDGFLRVFNYERMELLGVARSYFGGFLCVCWSPDGKYIVVGGEDDLVTVWSLNERRVVARGQGHRSWVSVVAFDPYTSYSHWDGPDFSDDENPANDGVGTYSRCCADDDQPQLRDHGGDRFRTARPMSSSSTIPDKIGTSYRLGSVSQDTQLCLWDITEDVLRQSHDIRLRLSSHDPSPVVANGGETLTADLSGLTGDSLPDSISIPAKSAAARLIDISHQSTTAEPQAANKMNKSKTASTSSKTEKSLDLSSSSNKSSHTSKSLLNDSNSSSGSGLTALNSLTLRLTNFSFGGGDSKKTTTDKKSSLFSKSSTSSSTNTYVPPTTNNHNSITEPAKLQTLHPAPPPSYSVPLTVATSGFGRDITFDSSRNVSTSKTPTNLAIQSPTGSVVPSYDPMQLIGTPVCPRFDECPLLEPLVCKKIAHERLTALIFREDCFLTACQDGLIYTWARPGYSCVD